jgi:hypothetical protein
MSGNAEHPIQILSWNPYPVSDLGSHAISRIYKAHFICGVEAIARSGL